MQNVTLETATSCIEHPRWGRAILRGSHCYVLRETPYFKHHCGSIACKTADIKCYRLLHCKLFTLCWSYTETANTIKLCKTAHNVALCICIVWLSHLCCEIAIPKSNAHRQGLKSNGNRLCSCNRNDKSSTWRMIATVNQNSPQLGGSKDKALPPCL